MPDQFDKQTGVSFNDADKPHGDAVGNGELEFAASEDEPEADETTGASPGTAQACNDLGLNSLEANLARFNIKPPGQA